MSIGVALFRVASTWACADADTDYCVDSLIGFFSFAAFGHASGLHVILRIPDIFAFELFLH